MRQGAASTGKLGGPLAGEPRLPVYATSARAWQGSDDSKGVCKHGLRRKADNAGTATTKQAAGDCPSSGFVPSVVAKENAVAASAGGRLKAIDEIRRALFCSARTVVGCNRLLGSHANRNSAPRSVAE